MGEMKKGILVGCHQEQPAFQPKFDTNNVVLVDDNGKAELDHDNLWLL